MKLSKGWLFGLGLSPLFNHASAEVVSHDEHQFTIKIEAPIAGPAEKTELIFRQIQRWWSKDHTYSGQAENLYFDFEKQKCFCEKMPSGEIIEHLRFDQYSHQQGYVFVGGLGPLRTMPVTGQMQFQIHQLSDDQSLFSLQYQVQSAQKNMLDAMKVPVNRVLEEQVQRLKAEVEK